MVLASSLSLSLNGLDPLSTTAVLCSVKAAFEGYTSVQMKFELDGNYGLGFLESMLLIFLSFHFKENGV